MNTNEIISQIDAEIARLTSVRNLLADAGSAPLKRGPGRPPKTAAPVTKRKHRLSAAARAKIAAAQKARWANVRAAKSAKSAAKLTKTK